VLEVSAAFEAIVAVALSAPAGLATTGAQVAVLAVQLLAAASLTADARVTVPGNVDTMILRARYAPVIELLARYAPVMTLKASWDPAVEFVGETLLT
jgi:hypothetical protein